MHHTTPPTIHKDPLEGKIIYVLVMTILVQFLYPLSVGNSPFVQIGFQMFYMSLFVAGIYLVSNDRRQMIALIMASLAWIVVGTIFTFRPDLQWANLVGQVKLPLVS
ncbi:MAG: hypothetical protein AAF542_26005 [Pseudomonadota bacterium]